MGDLVFEWDGSKAASNYAKHRVAFEDAARVFLDLSRGESVDEASDDGETRWNTIELVDDYELFVSYTLRDRVIR